MSALSKAIKDRDPAAIKASLDAGADPNGVGEFQRSPLHDAAAETTAGTALLLAAGARVNVIDAEGRTPLFGAHAETAGLLLAAGANPRIADHRGNTALHAAAEDGTPELARLLLDAGVPVDARNQGGLTPLHIAAIEGNQRVAALLLERRADIDAETTAPYRYKGRRIHWSVRGPGIEIDIPARQTALAISDARHGRNRWVRGRHAEFSGFLEKRGAKTQSWWR